MTVAVDPDLVALDRECYPSNPLSRRQWQQVWNRESVLVASQRTGEGKPTAYLIAVVEVEGGSECVKVKRLGVAPGLRRQGRAKGLLEAVGSKNCEAEVREDNLPALKLLTGCGFRPAGVLSGRFGEVDGVLLWREGRE